MTELQFITKSLSDTFSTASQTVSGALAILAAFVLYRLQVLKNEIDHEIDRIMVSRDTIHSGVHTFTNPIKVKFIEYCEATQNKLEVPAHLGWFVDEYTKIKKFYAFKVELKRRATVAIFFTISIVFYSLGVLANLEIISADKSNIVNYYAILWLLLTVSFFSYVWVIKYSLSDA